MTHQVAVASRMPYPTELPLHAVDTVSFYKRDEITTDLICCEVAVGDSVFVYHEELPAWSALIEHLQKLPNFRADWFTSVSQPPFDASDTVAFRRR